MKIVIGLQPKAQSRPRFSKWGTYEESSMKEWKSNFKTMLKLQKPRTIEQGAISLIITFYVKAPQYIVKKKSNQEDLLHERIFVDKRPDLDNYLKAVMDASNGILYKDDGQIAVIACQKLYSLKPRIEIEIERLMKREDEND